MPIPPDATEIAETLDPRDKVDCEVELSVASSPKVPAYLMPGESVASFELAETPEAGVAGLTILGDALYPPPVIVGNVLTFWVTVTDEMRGSPIFDGAGLRLALELTAAMSGSPRREKQRTIVVKVANR